MTPFQEFISFLEKCEIEAKKHYRFRPDPASVVSGFTRLVIMAKEIQLKEIPNNQDEKDFRINKQRERIKELENLVVSMQNAKGGK